MRPRSRLGQGARTHTAAQRRVDVRTGTPHSKDGEHPREGPSAPTRPGRQRRSGRIEVGSRSWQPSTRRYRARQDQLCCQEWFYGGGKLGVPRVGKPQLMAGGHFGDINPRALFFSGTGTVMKPGCRSPLLGGIANDAGVPCVRVHQAASKQGSRIPRQTLEVPKAQLGASPAAGRQLPRRR